MIGKSKPKVTFLTEGADWDLQQLARDLESYTFGMMQHLRVFDKMPLVFRDACVFGTGALKIFEKSGDIHIERVLINDIIVDECEVPSGGKPRQLHQFKLYNRDTLKGMFPKHADEIEASEGKRHGEIAYREVDPDMVLVVESWLLGEKGKKGRHTIVVEDATLLDEGYTDNDFPFVFYHWSPPLTGWYGQGLAESLMGFQIRINDLNDFIQRCQDLIAVPRVFIDAASRTLKVQLDNTIGAVIPYVGKEPTFFTPQALTAEIYNYKETLKTSAFEFAGISKMAAHATRPEGIEHGVALRELSDNQSQRFSIQQARYEEAYMDVGRMIVKRTRSLVKKGQKPQAFIALRMVEEIDWDMADLDEQKFAMRVMPSSILGETPAGKISKIIELAQYGVQLSQEELRRLLDHPDLALADKRATSALEHTEWLIGRWAKGEYVVPDPFMDLAQLLERGTAAYLDYQRLGAPEKILELFREGLLEAQRLMQMAAPQPPTLSPEEAAAAAGQVLPEGNVAESGLPGLVDPTQADTGETMLPGLTGSIIQ
jgi:hypothetical protein